MSMVGVVIWLMMMMYGEGGDTVDDHDDVW